MSAIQQLALQEIAATDAYMTVLERYLEKAEGAYAQNTLKAFRGDIEHYAGWCHGEGHAPFPALPKALISYIEACTKAYSRATIERRISSLRKAHQVLGLVDPKEDPDVQLAIERMKRRLGASQDQAQALTEQDVAKILGSIGQELIDLRDAALLLVARDMMGRRSEIVNLWVSDIALSPDGSGVAIIRKSKTDQEGHCTRQWLSPLTIEWVQIWLKKSGVQYGPIFRSVRKGDRVGGALSPDDVARIFKKITGRAGIQASMISGHSPRVGMTQDLCAAGMELTELMVAGRWKSPRMPARYAEKMQVSRGAVAKLYGRKKNDDGGV